MTRTKPKRLATVRPPHAPIRFSMTQIGIGVGSYTFLAGFYECYVSEPEGENTQKITLRKFVYAACKNDICIFIQWRKVWKILKGHKDETNNLKVWMVEDAESICLADRSYSMRSAYRPSPVTNLTFILSKIPTTYKLKKAYLKILTTRSINSSHHINIYRWYPSSIGVQLNNPRTSPRNQAFLVAMFHSQNEDERIQLSRRKKRSADIRNLGEFKSRKVRKDSRNKKNSYSLLDPKKTTEEIKMYHV
ncbi:hypothetical protein HELRODRAFT_177034 [Helobdella robusta]|uniref:Uncharacterized protein n=1 Tax=Helobdella robusta TaxID=6412 RepID=T1FB58_HELRO|nr:hypothetical protein HELRODRAFT_177034 [Helobdella robusta]ESN98555.1 hypothetical protein HELRODRAFT_177034 [Helobdella robusta]